MNDEPHVHQVRFKDRGHYWSIHYGDQEDLGDKPWRLFWESDERYASKCKRIVLKRISRLVRKHDRASRMAGMGVVTLPQFVNDKWGSEQLS